MKQVTFVNQWGYPDIHITREFCKKFISLYSKTNKDCDFDYFCFKDPDLLIDVCPVKINKPAWDSTKIFFTEEDRLVINAHHSFENKITSSNSSNRFDSTYNVFKKIFKEILGKDIEGKEAFVPTIDYRSFCCILPAYLQEKKLKQTNFILVDNSFSEYDFDDQTEYSKLVKNLAKKHKNSLVFTTENDELLKQSENVISLKKVFPFFSNINEISWFSKSCNTIIGKTKDYFSASLVKENLNDPRKTFVNIIETEDDILIPESLFKGKFLKINYKEVKAINEIL